MKTIDLSLLQMILTACAESIGKMLSDGQNEEVIPSEAVAFLGLLLEKHPEAEVSRFYLRELEGLK